jgi:uncharacterized protein
VVEDAELRAEHPELPRETVPGRRADVWVEVTVEEAYVHCRKHIPRLVPVDRRRSWGTDDARRKGGDHFGVAAARRAVAEGTGDGAADGHPGDEVDPRTAQRAGAGASSAE